MKLLFTLIATVAFLNLAAQTNADYYKKAEAYYDKKDYENALLLVNLALKTDSLNREYLLLKGNTLDYLGQAQAAYDTYSRMIELHPTDAIALNQRALLLYKIKEFEYAIQDFDKALSFMNGDTMKLSLYLNRGAAKTYIRDFKGAYDDLTSAYSIDSMDIGTLNNLAAVCDEVGKGDQTLRYLFRILTIDSTFIGAYGNIGFKYQEMGKYKTAIKYFDKVLTLEPNEPLAFNNRAFNKYKLGDFTGALTDVNRSIALYPGNSYAYRNRALIYLGLNKKKEACTDLEKALVEGFTKTYGDEVEQLKIKNCK